jgi:hypothetical protein
MDAGQHMHVNIALLDYYQHTVTRPSKVNTQHRQKNMTVHSHRTLKAALHCVHTGSPTCQPTHLMFTTRFTVFIHCCISP